MERIVVAYSGGLDTSVAIPWLAEEYGAEIVAVTLDIGKGREIADVRERGGKAIEAFGYRYAEGESIEQRFLVHRTVFPNDFLADFGFRTVRRLGRVELARLELGGLLPVEEKAPAKLLRRVREVLEPEPAPVPRRP